MFLVRSKEKTSIPPSYPGKKGFLVPWETNVRTAVPRGQTILKFIQVMFINSGGSDKGAPRARIISDDIQKDGLALLFNGETYTECCQPLSIFREAYCYLTYRIPWRRSFVVEQIKGFQGRKWTKACPISSVGLHEKYSALIEGRSSKFTDANHGDIKVVTDNLTSRFTDHCTEGSVIQFWTNRIYRITMPL